jgi:hypothetical protein
MSQYQCSIRKSVLKYVHCHLRVHNFLQAYVTQNLVHVFPVQAQHIFIVLSVLGNLWLLLLAGISFLSTQLVSNNCQFMRNDSFLQ